MKRFISYAFVAMFLVALAEPMMAYVLLSPRRRWASTPISVRTYYIGNNTIQDSDKGVTAVVNAIKV